MNWLSILTGVPAAAVDYFKRKAELKAERLAQRVQLEGALQQKKLEQISEAEGYEQAWNLAQIQNSGWKDEFWTIVLAAPFIGCFLPYMAPYVLRGFEIIEKTPEWYRWYVGVAISAAFGLQTAAKAYKWWNTP